VKAVKLIERVSTHLQRIGEATGRPGHLPFSVRE